VNSSSAFKAIIVIAVLLSITWKIAALRDNQNYLSEDFAEFFERNHFNVIVTEQIVNGMPIIRANAAACHLQVTELNPDGTDNEFVQFLATDADRFFIVFRGRAYRQQPILWTVLNYFWSKPLRELGLIRRITPVIAVTANSACDAVHIPWDELSGFSLEAALA
jgi:hypothetical protein